MLQLKPGQHIFVYGTLKQNHGNNRLLKNAKFIGKGRTVQDHFVMLDGGYPTVIPQGKFHVRGELFLVEDQTTLNNLDALEGVPYLFDHHEVTIKLDEGEEVEAVMYVGADQNLHRWSNRRFVLPDDDNSLAWRP